MKLYENFLLLALTKLISQALLNVKVKGVSSFCDVAFSQTNQIAWKFHDMQTFFER